MGIVEMNISASLIIAFTMLLRDTALKKLPNIMFCTLWGLVIIRLLVPWSITCEVSIFNLYYFFRDDILYQGDAFSTIQPISVETMIMQEGTPLVISGTEFIKLIWIAGVIVAVGICIFSYVGAFVRLKNCITLEEDSFAVKWIRAQKGFRKISVKLSWGLTTPVSGGIFFPTIILPYDYDIANEDILRHLLCHEYMHIKYHHTLWKVIMLAAMCINWFNPMVYVMMRYIIRDMEVFCDNRAVAYLKLENKKKYIETIIEVVNRTKQAEKKKNGKKEKRLFLYNGLLKDELKERVELLEKWKKVSALTAVASVMIVTSVTSVFATTSNAVVNDRQNDIVSEEYIDDEAVIQENTDVSDVTVPNMNTEKSTIIEGIDVVTLTENDVELPEERAARYLVVRNYKYVQYGYLPKKLKASIEQDGYIYEGTLDLDSYHYDLSTDKYTGYYSGKLYR